MTDNRQIEANKRGVYYCNTCDIEFGAEYDYRKHLQERLMVHSVIDNSVKKQKQIIQQGVAPNNNVLWVSWVEDIDR